MNQRQAVEDFLYHEASLLDRPDLDTWVSLFTEDGRYWMPAAEDQADPINHISHVYDDRVMMEIRRRNFVHPRASSKDWPVRCSHLIGNIRIHIDPSADSSAPDSGSATGVVLTVTSNQHVVVWYRDEQRVYAYRGTHRLLCAGNQFAIREKRVDLINPDAPQRSLIIYL